jgi:hypothetical protein
MYFQVFVAVDVEMLAFLGAFTQCIARCEPHPKKDHYLYVIFIFMKQN